MDVGGLCLCQYCVQELDFMLLVCCVVIIVDDVVSLLVV